MDEEDFFDANPWLIHLTLLLVVAGAAHALVWPDRYVSDGSWHTPVEFDSQRTRVRWKAALWLAGALAAELMLIAAGVPFIGPV